MSYQEPKVNRVKNDGEVDVLGNKDWNKTHDAKVLKKDSQSVMNQEWDSIHYSGGLEDICADPIYSDRIGSKVDK